MALLVYFTFISPRSNAFVVLCGLKLSPDLLNKLSHDLFAWFLLGQYFQHDLHIFSLFSRFSKSICINHGRKKTHADANCLKQNAFYRFAMQQGERVLRLRLYQSRQTLIGQIKKKRWLFAQFHDLTVSAPRTVRPWVYPPWKYAWPLDLTNLAVKITLQSATGSHGICNLHHESSIRKPKPEWKLCCIRLQTNTSYGQTYLYLFISQRSSPF